jgi:hypothetical protein
MNQTRNETLKTNQSIIITNSQITNSYIASQPMTYDFYLLYLLLTQENGECRTSTKNWINFCKSSSAKCLATSQLFINKNNGYIELYSIYDLTNTDDLCLPKAPKYIMTTKNFINFMVQKSQLYKERPHQFFIVIDTQGHTHLTTDLQSLTKTSFLGTLQKKLADLFIRPTK